MRSELGKMTFDKTFEERATLNEKITVCLLLFHPEFFVINFMHLRAS
jgi:hypothetical protein